MKPILTALLAFAFLIGQPVDARRAPHNAYEMRGTKNFESIDVTLNDVWKIYAGTKGSVTPADLLAALRNYGRDGSRALSQEGFYNFAAMISVEKRQHGE